MDNAPMRCVTLLTDFGSQDWFVAAMKGVILRIHPQAVIVDITHEIPPGDVAKAAYALASAAPYFPKETVHVAVVDPGVGGARRGLALKCGGQRFVGPDNGLFSRVLRNAGSFSARSLENKSYWLPEISRSFHGRDVFAPVGAHWSLEACFTDLGPPLNEPALIPIATPRIGEKTVQGTVDYIDRFGNAITNIPNNAADEFNALLAELPSGRNRIPLAACYEDVPKGEPLVLKGSGGFLEIAVNQGDAARQLGLEIGTEVRIRQVLERV